MHIRRIVLACLLFSAIPLGILHAEDGAAHGAKLNMSAVLFGELTDNTDRPFAVLPLFSVGSFRLQLAITKHFILMTAVGLLVLASMLYLARKLRDPYRRPTRLQSLFESLLEYMRDTVYEPVLGPEGKRFNLLCFTFFLFILYGNLLGMVPPFAPIVPREGGAAV
jgi:F-type H+-transporting ATPase subunit a